MDPQQFTTLRVEGNNGSARATRCIEDTANHERRAFQFVLGPGSETVGLEPPRDFELVEVARVDLIERRVLRAAKVTGVVRPLTVACRRRRRRLTRGSHRKPQSAEGRYHERGSLHWSPHDSHSSTWELACVGNVADAHPS